MSATAVDLDTKLYDLYDLGLLSVRVFHALTGRNNIHTLRDLLLHSEDDLLHLGWLGPKSVAEITALVAELGLELSAVNYDETPEGRVAAAQRKAEWAVTRERIAAEREARQVTRESEAANHDALLRFLYDITVALERIAAALEKGLR